MILESCCICLSLWSQESINSEETYNVQILNQYFETPHCIFLSRNYLYMISCFPTSVFFFFGCTLQDLKILPVLDRVYDFFKWIDSSFVLEITKQLYFKDISPNLSPYEEEIRETQLKFQPTHPSARLVPTQTQEASVCTKRSTKHLLYI